VDRKVYAVDVESGAVKWSSRLIGIVAGGVLVSGDTVYAASTRPEGRVNALDRSNGQRFWRVNVGFVSVPLTMVDRVLLVANQRGELLGLDPKTGARHWRRHTGVAFIAPVPLDSGEVLLATPDTLFRIATGDGTVRRRVRAPGPVVSPWIRMRDALVAGTADSLVLAIDPDSLTTRWKVRLDAPVMDSPAVAGDTVYAATRRGTLYRVLPGTPARRSASWSSTGRSPRRSPSSTASSCWAARTGRSGRSNPTGRSGGGSLSGGPSSSVPCRSTTAWWWWVAKATCTGTADDPTRHRASWSSAWGGSPRPPPRRTRPAGPVRQVAPRRGAVGFNLLAAESHQNADDAFNTLEDLCFEDFDRCDWGPTART
jgi:outer membrane protein assembly factor BamB